MLSALTVAPLFQEAMFRGFALNALQDAGYRFWPANTIAAILFLGLHLAHHLFHAACPFDLRFSSFVPRLLANRRS